MALDMKDVALMGSIGGKERRYRALHIPTGTVTEANSKDEALRLLDIAVNQPKDANH